MKSKKKVALHACCAVCLGHPHKLLNELGYEVEVIFYNPNIYPTKEYEQRKSEVIRFCNDTNTELTIIEDNPSVYYNFIKGLEGEPEKGLRCERCFQLRLNKTAEIAKQHGVDYFSTTLSVSPHKDFSQIKLAAESAAKEFDIQYLEFNFKKQNGFKKTNEIAQSYNFYRQSYCGCEYSIRKEQELLQKA